MHTRLRTLIAGLAVLVALGAAVSTASANRLSFSSRPFRAVWATAKFYLGETAHASCKLTLEGSFTSATISKVRGAVIGKISRASVATCTEGNVTVLAATLPWSLAYESFEGTLPAIRHTNMEAFGEAFQVTTSGITCLMRSTTEAPTRWLIWQGFNRYFESALPLTGELGLCALGATGHIETSEGTFTALGTSTAITITLI
jgi:hypothetical protein